MLKIPKKEEIVISDVNVSIPAPISSASASPSHMFYGQDVMDSVLCSDNTEISCQTTCRGDHLQKYIRQDNVLESGNFWMFFLLMTVAYSAFSVVSSMGDALCFNIL